MRHLGYLANWTDTQGRSRADSELREYTRNFLTNYYDLVWVPGYANIAAMRDDIVTLFMSKVFDEETPPISFYGQYGSSELEKTVKAVSPSSRMKSGVVFVQTRLPETTRTSSPAATQLYTVQCPPSMAAACTSPGVFDPYTCNCIGGARVTSPATSTYSPPPQRAGYWTDAEGKIHPDSELESYAWSYLNNYYDLRPMGSETVQQLKERIMYAFLRYQGVTSSGATFDSEIGPVTMDEVVRAVSPMSTKKAKPVASANTQIAIKQQGVIPALTRPGVGKVPVKADWTQLFALVESGMVGYANAQKQQAAAQLMAIQNSGQPLYVDYRTAQNMAQTPNKTVLYAGLGAVVLLGGLFLLLGD